ncbi:MAG: SMC-Scp complex subunit ScpB [Candidatus Margulisiibacteriota bacterium]
MEQNDLKQALESILFVARKPLSLEEICEVTGSGLDETRAAAEELVVEYDSRGIKIFKVAGGFLMGTSPKMAEFVQKILSPKIETTLSPRALETLAIIAYKQPVTRLEIERLRGVDSTGVIDSLLAKKLIKELGRSDALGHPFLFGTTDEFLRHFGLHDLDSLPELPATEEELAQVLSSALIKAESPAAVEA